MAERPIYIPDRHNIGVAIKPVEFTWHAGLSVSQAQKSIAALHQAAAEQGLTDILEISTKSPEELGVAYSGFRLYYRQGEANMPVECAFEGSKIFAQGGPYTDIYKETALEAKRDPRLEDSGALKGYAFFGAHFPAEPPSYFYDWLYAQAAWQSENHAQTFSAYHGFTDLEINPHKRKACQAYSAALYVSLRACGKLEQALRSPQQFLALTEAAYAARAESEF